MVNIVLRKYEVLTPRMDEASHTQRAAPQSKIGLLRPPRGALSKHRAVVVFERG